MKNHLTILVLFLGFNGTAQAGWERISPDTIRVTGDIDRDSYQDYLKVAEGGYSTLILKSAGGVPPVALQIAEDVASRDVSVVVDGYCLSACANYLAFSGQRLTVKCDSFLAWHGTLETPDKALVNMRAKHEPEALITAYIQWLTDFKTRERSFFEKIDIDYRLLQDATEIIRAENVAPEVSFNLDEFTGDYSVTRSAALWIPTPDVLQDYGVDTKGFCQRYEDDDIISMLQMRGITMPFTSKGRQPESGTENKN